MWSAHTTNAIKQTVCNTCISVTRKPLRARRRGRVRSGGGVGSGDWGGSGDRSRGWARKVCSFAALIGTNLVYGSQFSSVHVTLRYSSSIAYTDAVWIFPLKKII